MSRPGPALAALALAAACRVAPVAPPPAPIAAATPAASPVDAGPATAPTGDPVIAAAAAMVALYEALALLDRAACPAAGDRARTLIAARTADRTILDDATRGARRAEVDARFEAAAPRLAAALARIDALVTRCAGDPALTAALATLAPAER